MTSIVDGSRSADFLHHRGFVMPQDGHDLDPVLADVVPGLGVADRLPGNEIRRVTVQDNEPEGSQGEERKGQHGFFFRGRGGPEEVGAVRLGIRWDRWARIVSSRTGWRGSSNSSCSTDGESA